MKTCLAPLPPSGRDTVCSPLSPGGRGAGGEGATTPTTHRSQRRSAYTLLEVLLVLAITTVLIAAVGSAINIYLRSVEAGRAEVEQAQLARALLRRIADDLRSAVPIAPADGGVESSSDALIAGVSSALGGGGSGSSGGAASGGSSGSSSSANIQNITSSTGVTNIDGSQGVTDLSKSGSSGGSGSNSPGSSGRSGGSSSGTSGGGSASGGMSGGTSSGGGASSGSSTGTGASMSESESTGEATVAPLGVYGSQYDLQVDVSRLPRTDRMDSLTGTIVAGSAAAALDPPSDVKTVSYYIAALSVENTTTSTIRAQVNVADSLTGGLVRREVDRSVINFGTLYGGSSEVGTTEQLLAPEATAIEFRYFDGTEWLTDWSSSDRSAVPVAVEILLTLRAPDEPVAGTTWLVASPSVPQEQTYRLLVHLPAGQPSSAGDAAMSTESTTGDASSTTGASP